MDRCSVYIAAIALTLSLFSASSSYAGDLCFSIPKMHCGGCVDKISENIENTEGVKAVSVNLETKSAKVTPQTKASKNLEKSLVQVIEDSGYPATLVSCESVKPKGSAEKASESKKAS